VYNQPMVLNERQTGAAIEGVMRHNETRADGGLLRLAVDTHGYTNVGMAVAKLLGFDLCPWLRNLSERKLYLPRALSVTEGLSAAVSHEVSLKVGGENHFCRCSDKHHCRWGEGVGGVAAGGFAPPAAPSRPGSTMA
ncbi:transposase, partial [Escherichia coli]|nr:transposase [Escherichia coli]